MKLLYASIFLVTVSSTASADVSIMDNGKSITVDCAKDPNVDLSGNEITATLDGVCNLVAVRGNKVKVSGSVQTLAVLGNENEATLDAVDTIKVTGNKNSVTYKKTVNTKLAKPKIGNVGRKNKIAKS